MARGLNCRAALIAQRSDDAQSESATLADLIVDIGIGCTQPRIRPEFVGNPSTDLGAGSDQGRDIQRSDQAMRSQRPSLLVFIGQRA